MAEAVVLCPLEIERRAIAAAARSVADVRRTGPGEDAMAAAVKALLEDGERPRLVVLAGLAGGLTETEETAPRIGRVVDLARARHWRPTVMPPGDGDPVTIVGLSAPAFSKRQKKQMFEATGAALADCESHAFASACQEAGLRWAVVRGVSDGPEDGLPESAVNWVDERGYTRAARVLGSALIAPALLPTLWKLSRRSRAALRAVSGRVVELLAAQGMRSDRAA